MRCEDIGIGFLVLLLEIAARGIGAEAARIDAHHVDGGFAIDDPFGELPARTASCGDAEAVALIEPEILEAPGGSDDRRAIGRIGDGTVVDFLDSHFAEGRDTGDGRFDMGGKPVKVFLEELVFTLIRRAVNIANRRAFLIGAKQQPAIFLAHVPA